MAATDILGKIGEKVGGQIKTLETSITNDFATKAELSTLQGEVDTTQAGAGLAAGGTYTASSASNYLTAATSLVDADNKLDAQSKANADAISDNADAIDVIESSAGLGVAGAYIPETNSNYINGASTLAQADALLDTQVGTNATNIGTNTTAITGLTNDKYDKSGGTISGAVTITGDLTVQGTTTTVTSTEVSVADNTIEVNLASDGSVTAATGGFNVNRGNNDDGDALPKAGAIWDNDNSYWTFKLGTGLTDVAANKVYFKNVWDNAASLPAASANHGLFAHAHAEGRAYFAHANAWHQLLDVNGGQTISGVTTIASGASINAANNSGFTINSTPIGDYSTFESAFNTAIA